MDQDVTHPAGSKCDPSIRLHRGRASYFYSRDIGRIWRVAGALEYGIVGINEGIISTEIAPLGGMKESGIGPIL
jgi:acyl-CoA reductase-like NAD-dependent aldehyde dehydrogenase